MKNYSQKIMDFTEGVTFMKSISKKGRPEESFIFGEFTIIYPGFKKEGDYKLTFTENGEAPRHTDVVDIIASMCTSETRDTIVTDLEAIFNNGLKAKTTVLEDYMKNKIYWIALQEEINYPQPRYKGIKLPFQRFFEATLICLGLTAKENVHTRTNNHSRSTPTLIELGLLYRPSFYN